jgi:hypothetical protein
MKNIKRIGSIMIVVVLMLVLSMSAFATGSVFLYVNGVYQGAYSIGSDSTVYDIVSQLPNVTWGGEYNANSAFSPLCDTSSPLYGKYNMKAVFMRSLNGISSAAYEPVDGALDEDDYYIPTQTVDEVLAQADSDLAAYGGLKYWLGNGYGIAADWQHMVYIGWDWEFTVNGVMPGMSLYSPDPTFGNEFLYTMRESLLANGDRIDLNYVFHMLQFDNGYSY